MESEIPEELIDLLERLSEGDLDESGRGRLVALLQERPDLRRVVAEHFAVAGALGRMGKDETDFAARTAVHVAKVAFESDFAFARKVTRKIVRGRILKGLSIAALLSLALLPFLWKRPAPGAQVATLVKMEPEKGFVSARRVAGGTVVEEGSGLFRLDFDNGAVLAVQAPAKLTVISATEILLESGSLNGWCPESAHGFKVRSASAALTDLGTSFGVSAFPGGKAEFVVLEGMVEVEKNGKTVRLAEGNAIESTAKDPLKSVVFDPSGYKKTWPLSHGILSTRGALTPSDPDIPEKVALMESDDHVLVIPERRSVPFTGPLQVEMTGPGTLPGDFDGSPRILPPAPKKRLSSVLVRYDPVGTSPEDHFVHFEGEVTFDRPVFAIAGLRDSLEKSDAAFATASWDALHRGIELEQIRNAPDSVTLSADRRTVKVIFYAGISTDEIRVILEDP